MKVEEQLGLLAELSPGLKLDEGITVEDVLYSFEREDLEQTPFELLLFCLGTEVEREPWGRAFCSHVWNFDRECISSSGDYQRIVKRLCVLSGDPHYLKDIEDDVNLNNEEAWVSYLLPDGKQRKWKLEVDDDWADFLGLSYVMDDLQRDGNLFYSKDNGQAMLLFYLSPNAASELNRLANDALQPVLDGE